MKALLLAVTLANPILFVTQVPVPGDFTTVASAFGNQVPELRTPLTAILGWSRILTATSDPEEMKEGLQAIHSCASTQKKLIRIE